MTSIVSSILQHSANKIDDMPFLGSRSKRKSAPPVSGRPLQLATSVSTPHIPSTAYRPRRNSDYSAASPPPYETMSYAHQTPTQSASWTSDISVFADKLRDDSLSVTSSKQVGNLDRKSISQGLKLVSIAADEFDEGNEDVALDIYLTGLDKILMALPNKTDPKTKQALRDKLLSVEERVGILNLASQVNQKRQLQPKDDMALEVEGTRDPKLSLRSYVFSRISITLRHITNTSDAHYQELASPPSKEPKSSAKMSRDSVNRFKQFGQFIIHVAVTLAVAIKQSPIPDILYFLFGYFIQLLLWLDAHYHIWARIQAFGIDCVKFLLHADEEYRLHEFVSEALYMLVAAGLKAVVAFKEAPSYRQQQQRRPFARSPPSAHPQDNVYRQEPLSPVAQKPSVSRIAWKWSPW